MTERRFPIRYELQGGEDVKRRFEEIGAAGQRAHKQIEESSRPAGAGLKALDASAGELRGRLEGLAGRAGPLGSALGALGPVGLAAAAGIGALTLGFQAATAAAAEAEKVELRLQGVYKATGAAVGLSLQQLDRLAQKRAGATVFDDEQVKEQIAALATFRQVSGEAFERAIGLAQDMAAVFGTDLRSATVQLGKALQEPVEGLTALRRVGVTFSESQKEVIEQLVRTGEVAAAQKIVLDELARQVGGAAETEAGGLAGAARGVAKAWDDMLEAWGRTPAVGGTVQAVLQAIRAGLDALRGVAEPAGAADRFQALRDELADPGKRVGVNPLTGATIYDRARTRSGRPRSEVEAELEAVAELMRREAALEAQRRAAAEAGAERAAAEARADTDRAAATEARKKAVQELNAVSARNAVEYDKQREAASKRAQEIIAADARRNRSVEEYIAGLETAAELEGLSTVEKKTQEAILAAQARLVDEQGHRLRELTAEEKARIANAVRVTEEIKAQRAAAEKAAKEMERAWEHTIDRVTDIMADTLFDWMEGKSRDFWDDFVRLAKRAAAQVAAQVVIRIPMQLLGQAFGLPVGGAGGGGLAGGLFGGGATGGGGLGSLGSLLNVLPNPLSFLGGSNPLTGLGSAIGGALGLGTTAGLTATAAALGPLSTAAAALDFVGVGGLTAGAAGGAAAISPLLATGIGALIAIPAMLALGGIFGGKKSVGPNASAGLAYQNGSFVVGNRGADNNGDLAGAVSAMQSIADWLNGLQTSYGIKPANVLQDPWGSVAGSAGGAIGIGSGKAWIGATTPDAVLKAMLAGGYLTAESEVIKQVLVNSKAADSAALEADLAFGKLYEQLTTVVDPATELTRAMEELSKSFDDAYAKAGELGLSQTKLREGMRDQFELDVERQIRALTDPLGLALEDFERGASLRLATAAKLGADLVKVEELTALERSRVVAQYASGLKSLFDEVAFGGLSGLSPSASYDAVKAQLGAAVAGGDAAGIESYGRQFISLSREMFASGAGFQADRDYLLGVLGSVLAPNDNAATAALLSDANAIAQAHTGLFVQMRDRLESLTEEFRRFREWQQGKAA